MMRLSEAAAILNSSLAAADTSFSGVSTDSRSLMRGELFVALSGERYDGHAFLHSATLGGAAGALIGESYDGHAGLPVIRVVDTRKALGALAREWRSRLSLAVIAVAGSNGKTTTKEMIASVLRCHAGEHDVLATEGNLNNDIGVPLTLLKIRRTHRFSVVEVGMSHSGEIARLAGCVQPTVAVVTNAQREHLEFMGSAEDAARENAQIYRALPVDGTAIINIDDPNREIFKAATTGRKTISFGLGAEADVTARFEQGMLSSLMELHLPSGAVRATLNIPGSHSVRNALAAAAAAHAVGVPAKAIGEGLEAFRPYSGRLQLKRAESGATLIDDTYNANPDSVRAAIDVLASAVGPKIMILGDMGEVGELGSSLHSEMGAYARQRGIDEFLGLGQATLHAVQAFGKNAQHFNDLESIARRACEKATADATLLVKGSRFMRMERVVRALQGRSGPGSGVG